MEKAKNTSAVAEHSSQCSRYLQPSIVCRESHFRLRQIKESLLIRNNMSINRDKGVEVSSHYRSFFAIRATLEAKDRMVSLAGPKRGCRHDLDECTTLGILDENCLVLRGRGQFPLRLSFSAVQIFSNYPPCAPDAMLLNVEPILDVVSA
ncbi:hypothetical protein TTRE_0000958001 [Trichuris trichiura]|uniref:Uncharacterized protein n=1 Tax=Trichuris trichiura TaxID=36087 RepID=A0A077ZLI6_TRITR|nr:hypothetical protein TTRE_0000958001 [Trichuris trichiura]